MDSNILHVISTYYNTDQAMIILGRTPMVGVIFFFFSYIRKINDFLEI